MFFTLPVRRIRLWHKLDTRFLQPRGSTYFALTSPHARSSAKAAALTQLTVDLLVRPLAHLLPQFRPEFCARSVSVACAAERPDAGAEQCEVS